MNVFIFHDGRYYIDQSGSIWTQCNADYDFWSRYLSVYKSVTIVARAKSVDSKDVGDSFRRVNVNEDISLYSLPYFTGPKQYTQKFLAIRKSINVLLLNVTKNDSLIIRAPLSFFIPKTIYKCKYGIEVVGDAFESLNKGTLITRIFASIYARAQKKLVRKSYATSYVTKQALQKRYPSPEGSFTTNYSSINLQDNDYKFLSNVELTSKYAKTASKVWRFVAVGSLEFDYKGADVLIKSLSELIKCGYRIQTTWLGGGKLLDDYKLMAEKYSLQNYIEFKGAVGKKSLKEYLINSDLFILPSKTEGLPRAMIEAMAFSLVCVGTNVGGVGELITQSYLSESNSVSSLTEVISNTLQRDTNELVDAARRNYDKAKEFHKESLELKRTNFYKELL